MFDLSQLHGEKKAERCCCSWLWLSLLGLRLVVLRTWVMGMFGRAAGCSAVIKEDNESFPGNLRAALIFFSLFDVF